MSRASSVISTARVHLRRDGQGFDVPLIELTTTASVPGIDDAAFQQLAAGAKIRLRLAYATPTHKRTRH